MPKTVIAVAVVCVMFASGAVLSGQRTAQRSGEAAVIAAQTECPASRDSDELGRREFTTKESLIPDALEGRGREAPEFGRLERETRGPLLPGTIDPSQVPFDVRDIVRRASGRARGPGDWNETDTGEFLVDTGVVYGVSTAFDGTNYLVVWDDYRNPGTIGCDIYGARVSKAGGVLDPSGIVVTTMKYDQQYPAVAASIADGKLLVNWQGFAEYAGSKPANSVRIWGKLISAGPDVGVTRIMAPTGQIDFGTEVVPACSVHNYGNTIESYQVRMRIGTDYEYTYPVYDHASGELRYVEFVPMWKAGPLGEMSVTCATELEVDCDPENDEAKGTVLVGLPGWSSGWKGMARPEGEKPVSAGA